MPQELKSFFVFCCFLVGLILLFYIPEIEKTKTEYLRGIEIQRDPESLARESITHTKPSVLEFTVSKIVDSRVVSEKDGRKIFQRKRIVIAKVSCQKKEKECYQEILKKYSRKAYIINGRSLSFVDVIDLKNNGESP